MGAIHSAKISGTEWIGSVQPEKFRKNQSTFRKGPLFSVEPVRSKWTVPFDLSGPFSITGPRFLVTSMYKMEESTALLWVVDSGSIGVTRTYMYNYDGSVAASQAKCMFWLRICKFFSSFDSKTSNVVFEVTWQIFGNCLLKITRYTS